MDIEQLFTQIFIAVFTVIFFVFASRVKSNIEKRYRKGTENLKHAKEKMKEISIKQSFLCKKVLCESTNRHQRSIIAASLKQTLDEEMEKLAHIKDSIKLVQQIPDLKPSFQQFDRDFFPGFGGISVFNLGSKEANGDKNKNGLLRRKDSQLQSKLCNAWRAQSRRYLQNDNSNVKNESKKQSNDFKCGDVKNSISIDKQVQAITNFTVHNVSIINFRDNHIESTKETLEKIMEGERSENEPVETSKNPNESVEPFEVKNESVKTLPDIISESDETIEDVTQKLYFNDLIGSENNLGVCTLNNKNINLYNCPATYSNFNNKIDKCRPNTNNMRSDSFFILLDNNDMENQIFVEKGISYKQIRKDKNYVNNHVLKFDLFYPSTNKLAVKKKIEKSNNKGVLYPCCTMEGSMKDSKLKIFQVRTKENRINTNTVVSYVLKLSLKINKKKVVFKKYELSSYDKEKSDKKRLGYGPKKQLQNNTNLSRVQSKHRSLNRKPNKKRHSIYTNTSLISTEERKNKHWDNNNYVTLAEGDVGLTDFNHKRKGSKLNNTKNIEHFGNQDSEEDKAILKQCVQMNNNNCSDFSQFIYTSVSQPTQRQRQEFEMLPIIEEETTSDNSDESFEKIKTKVSPNIKFEIVSNQSHKEKRLVEKFDRNELVHQLPLFYKEPKLHNDKSKIQNKIQTTLNLKASQILEKISLNKLNDNNSPTHNMSEAPRSLTCVFELRSFDNTMYMQNIFMNRLNEEMLNIEDYNIVQNMFQRLQPSKMNYSSSCLSILNNKDHQNEKSQVIEYKGPLYSVDGITLDEEVNLRCTTSTNSVFMKETIFKNNESDESYFNTQTTSSTVVIVEGAVFSSSDNSRTTIIWDENDSQTDLSDDETSKTSESA